MPTTRRPPLFSARTCLLAGLLGSVLAGPGTAAQRTWWVEPSQPESGRLVNGSFDTDVSGWVVTDPVNVPMSWDATDATGNPSSGSALLVTSAVPTNNGGVFQCIWPVVPGAAYTLHGRIRVASGQPALGGGAGIFLRAWSSFSCNGSAVGAPAATDYIGTDADPSSLDVWVPVTATLTMPEGAQSLWVYLNVQRWSSPTGFAARFDAITIDFPLSADGFERGDLLAWDGEQSAL